MDGLEKVDLVDNLMTYYRNNSEPPKDMIIQAYELGINVRYLKEYVHGYEQEQEEDMD